MGSLVENGLISGTCLLILISARKQRRSFFSRKGNEDSPFPPRFNDNPTETAKVHISISIRKYINAVKY